jgi:hypothetical protein
MSTTTTIQKIQPYTPPIDNIFYLYIHKSFERWKLFHTFPPFRDDRKYLTYKLFLKKQ